MATPGLELAFLAYPVWTKFTALALACGLAAWALLRQRGWLPALLCVPAPIAIWFGLAPPYRWSESAVSTIALGWIAMLAWAAWRAWRGHAPDR